MQSNFIMTNSVPSCWFRSKLFWMGLWRSEILGLAPRSVGQKEEETRIFDVISVYCGVYRVVFDVQYLEELAHAVFSIS